MAKDLLEPVDCSLEALQKILSRRPLLWVGAGMSVAAGFPTATKLVEAMHKMALKPLPKDKTYDQVTDAFIAAEGLGSLRNLLSQQFPQNKPLTSWHHSAARLYKSNCFSSVVTTNYDNLLERAFSEAGCVFELQTLDRNQELPNVMRILKIHGGTDDYQSLVLSRSSYAAYGKQYKFLRAQLEQLFVQQPILFVGCSMTDPRLLDWLGKASARTLRNLNPWWALITQAQMDHLNTATYGKDPVIGILAKAHFQVLSLRNYAHVPELFQALAPLMEQRHANGTAPPASQASPAPSPVPASTVEAPMLFVGRKAEQEQLIAGMAQTDSVQVIYQLLGSGGMGKTALAQQVAAACQDRFERVLSFNMAEQNPQSFAVALARALNHEPNEPGDDKAARREISRLLGQRRILLLLDNVTDPKSVANLLPEGGKTCVLITTRERAIGQVLHEYRGDLSVTTLELGQFSPEENRQLFQRVLRDYKSGDEPTYDAIGATLGYLPVALRLAVNWMVYAPHWSAVELLDNLKTEKLKVLSQVRGKVLDESLQNLQTVYQLDTKMSGPQRRILRHLAVCAEGPVPLSFMEIFHRGSKEQLRDDLEELYSRSWCQRSQGEEPTYELHVLVRALIREHENIPNMQERFLVQILQIYTNENEAFTLKDRWTPQVQEALNTWQKKPDPRCVALLDVKFFRFCQRRGYGSIFVSLADLVLAKFPKNQRFCATAMSGKALILKAWGRLDEAYALHQKEEAINESLGNRAGLAICYGNQATILHDWGRLDEAYALYQKEEAIEESLGNRAGLAGCYGNQAGILYAWGRLDEAYALYQKQEAINESQGNRADLAVCYGNQAGILYAWGRLDEAYALHKKEEAIKESLGNRAGLAACYGNQAVNLRAWGMLNEAYALYQKQESIEESQGNPSGLATCYGNQALILKAWGRLDEAYGLHQKEEVIKESLGNRDGLADCYGNQALILSDWGRLDEAYALHQKEEAIKESLGNRAGQARCYGNQAGILYARGRLDEAYALFQKEEAIEKSLGNRTGQGICFTNQASILKAWGRSEAALALFSQAETIFIDLNDKASLAQCYDGQGWVHRDQGRLDEALDLHERAAQLFGEVGAHEFLASNLDYQALVQRDLGVLDLAQALNQKALELWEKMGHLRGKAACLGNQAVLLALKGDAEAAQARAAEAERLWADMGERFERAYCWWNQGALVARSARSQAEQLWHKAVAAGVEMGLPTASWQDWLDQWSTAADPIAMLASFPFANHG